MDVVVQYNESSPTLFLLNGTKLSITALIGKVFVHVWVIYPGCRLSVCAY